MNRPKKRSIAPHGHSTSISLEDVFWESFCDIAHRRRISINALIEEVDETRGQDCTLASAVRIYVLEENRASIAATRTAKQSDV